MCPVLFYYWSKLDNMLLRVGARHAVPHEYQAKE